MTSSGALEGLGKGTPSLMISLLRYVVVIIPAAFVLSRIFGVVGVKTLKLDIPLVPETRINWAFVSLHITIIYILKLCLDEEIIPRCRFPYSRGYLTKCINWQKKQ